MAGTDLAQYNGTPSFPARTDVGTNTDPYFTVTDGPVVTADANPVGAAPVNMSIKRVKDLLLGLRGAIVGDFAGAAIKTIKSLAVDGTGGNASTAAAGTASVSAVYGGATTPQTALPHGTLTKDSPVFGYGNVYWSGVSYSLEGGLNVFGITQPGGAGSVLVTLSSAAPVGTSCVIVVTSYRNGGSARIFEVVSAPVNVASKLTFTVNMYDAAGALMDSGFSFVCHSAAA